MTKTFFRPRAAAIAAGLLVVGGAAGAVVAETARPSVTMAPATPVAIRSLSGEGIVTVRGRVAEVYGNKFILADGSGRALVDAGREGEGGKLVAPNEAVTVQGRFDDGFIRAAFLVRADGKVEALGPLHGPKHRGPGEGHGRRDRDDDDDGPDGRTPPPPPAGAPAAPAPAAAPTN